MLDKDEIAKRRAVDPQQWSVIDSWAQYVRTRDIRVLQDEIATNPEFDAVRGILYFAFGDRDLQVLAMLAQSGVSFQESDDPWSTDSILCSAIEDGGDCPEIVRWLLDRGASMVRCTMNRWTPLHLAAIRNFPDVIEALLERGGHVDVGTEIDGEWTPLMEACRSGSVQAVAALIQHGADVRRCRQMTGTSVVDIAKKSGHPEIVAMLEAAARSRR